MRRESIKLGESARGMDVFWPSPAAPAPAFRTGRRADPGVTPAALHGASSQAHHNAIANPSRLLNSKGIVVANARSRGVTEERGHRQRRRHK